MSEQHTPEDCPQRVDVTTLLDTDPVYMHGCPAAAVVVSSARFSDDGRHRYWLDRHWDLKKPPATFLMLNPSTADARVDDPTIRRCRGFAEALGCGGITVVNLYAYRTKSPDVLFDVELSPEDRIGPENDTYLMEAAIQAGRSEAPLIGAWGTRGETDRINAVLDLPGMNRITALALTRSGMPRHPLYLPKTVTPEPWVYPTDLQRAPGCRRDKPALEEASS